jgi:hypothetical protein
MVEREKKKRRYVGKTTRDRQTDIWGGRKRNGDREEQVEMLKRENVKEKEIEGLKLCVLCTQ